MKFYSYLNYIYTRSPRDSFLAVKHTVKKILFKKDISNSEIIFVLSTGRVGSMSLARLMGLASNLRVRHEPSPKLFRLSKANYLNNFANLEEAESIFWTVREDLINEALSFGKGYVETSPQGTFFAPVIHKAIPSVKFIHLIRHPAEVVTSGMRRSWFKGHPYDNTRIVPNSSSEYYFTWNSMSQFEKNAWLWAETNEWILNFLKAIPDNQKMTVRAEDLYCKNLDSIKGIFQFVGVSIPPEKQINRVLSKKHNQQTKGSFPKFEDWSPEMLMQLKRISGDTAKNLGYDI